MSLPVVRRFIKKVEEQAAGLEVRYDHPPHSAHLVALMVSSCAVWHLAAVCADHLHRQDERLVLPTSMAVFGPCCYPALAHFWSLRPSDVCSAPAPLLLCQVLDGVTPQVQFVKVVSDELVELMGSAGSKELETGTPQIILMAGLQVGTGYWSSSSGSSDGSDSSDSRQLQLRSPQRGAGGGGGGSKDMCFAQLCMLVLMAKQQ